MTLFGYYYACDDRARQLVPYYSQYNYGPDLFYGYSLIEFLVKNYTYSEDIQMADTYKYNRLSREQIVKDVGIFCDAVNKYCLTPAIIREVTFHRVWKAIIDPELEFLNEIKNVKFSLDRRKNDSYMPLFESLSTMRQLSEQYTSAQWVQASIKVSDAGFREYLQKKKNYDRLRQRVHLPHSVKSVLLKYIRYRRSMNKYEQ